MTKLSTFDPGVVTFDPGVGYTRARERYPARTERGDGGEAVVVCEVCGNRSVGNYFGAVWSKHPQYGDAWRIHGYHVDSGGCRPQPTVVVSV